MNKKRIITVEGCSADTKTIWPGEHLKKAGFANVFQFLKTTEALDALPEINPDLIICDIDMPDLDGWQLCKILKSEKYRKFNRVPVILLSTLCKDTYAELLAFEVGASAVLQVPYESQDLITLISDQFAPVEKNRTVRSTGFKKRMVIADDNEDLLKVSRTIFQKEDYEVHTAMNGQEAMEVIEKTKPHIVLLDYQLPGKNGLDVLKWLKKKFPETVSVILTAHGSETVAINFMKEGADDYLPKPYRSKKIIDTCNAAFNKYNVRLIGNQFRMRANEFAMMEEQYHTIVDNSSDFIYLLDNQGKFSFVNREVKPILGFKPEEMIGMSFDKFIELTGASPHIKKQFFEHRTGDRSGEQFEIRMIHKNGRNANLNGIGATLKVSARGLYSPMLDSNLVELEVKSRGLYSGQKPTPEFFRGTLGIARNISERKLMRERLFHAEKLSSVGTLVSGVAHELNNPLATISGFSELLMGEASLSESTKSELKIIFEESQRCAKIVQSLLSFSRKHKIEKELIDVNEVIQKTVELVNYHLRASNIALHTDFEKRIFNVFGDFQQIQQVFLNILNNAVHAVCDSDRKRNIWINTEITDGERVVVAVKNSGPPICDEFMKKVFDSFFTTKDVGKGTGLGLSISHRIMSDHGGTIEAENLQDGVLFRLEFPLPSREISTHPKIQKEKQDSSVQRKHILLVDDEKGIRDLLKKLMEKDGHVVTTASSGEKAVERIKTESFDLIVSDLKMPDMDGIMLYDHVKAIRPELGDRFILMTGAIEDAVCKFSQKTGNLYIQKPFRRSEIRKLFSEVFR